MRVFNKTKTTELLSYDLENGYLQVDRLFIKHHEAVEAVEGSYHYETVKEYPNGGKDVKKVWDSQPVEAVEAWDEYEEIKVYIPYTLQEKQNRIRQTRVHECYSIINRGELWYKRLSNEQKTELDMWYQSWLDAPKTMIIPEKPSWLE